MSEIRIKVLLVDDDPSILRLFSMRLTSEGFEVETADCASTALTRVAIFRPHVVVTDLRMGEMDGLALFAQINQTYPTLPVIIITAQGSIDDAVTATQRGVHSFLTKPVDKADLIQRIRSAVRLVGESVPAIPQESWRSRIVTQSPLMEELLHQVRFVAQGNATIYIHGESGTGKELFARAIHEVSPRAALPFVAVNCNAIPEYLLESELFGHVKGAFTGAARDHLGLFRAANGGSLFLDEIGDIPKSFQVKLLRALQERKVRPVGATRDYSVDIRIISASHVDLYQAMRQDQFREDLYYRLSVVTLAIPPLSRRAEDIPLLASHFMREFSVEYGGRVKGFSPEAIECLCNYDWPGNVRQLQNVVEQCVALSTTPLVPVTLLERALRGERTSVVPLQEAKDQFEREYLVKLMQITQGNVTQAARLAKRNRTEFYRLLNRHGMSPTLFKHA